MKQSIGRKVLAVLTAIWLLMTAVPAAAGMEDTAPVQLNVQWTDAEGNVIQAFPTPVTDDLTGLTPAIIRFLEDTTVPKVGLSLHDDMLSLSKRGEFTPGNFIDLQDHMTELGIQDLSLQKLYANIFHGKISKTQQLSNWEADILSDRQKIYAATDAWACIMLYREYQRMIKTHDFELQITEEGECEEN